MWPCMFLRATTSHDANMAALHFEQVLIRAADLLHDALRLAGWRDMVGQSYHIEQTCANTAQVYMLTTNDHLPLNQPILLVEFLNELEIGCPGHRNEIIHPGVHGVPCFHDTRVI